MKCEILTGNMPQLWEQLLLQLTERNYSPGTLRIYREAVGRIYRFMRTHGIPTYNKATGLTYVTQLTSEKSLHPRKRFTTPVYRLNDILDNKPYTLIHLEHNSVNLLYFNDLFEKFVLLLNMEQLKPQTQTLQSHYCNEFLLYLEQHGIKNIEEINAQIIYDAFHASGSKENFRCVVKKLLKYLYNEKLIALDLSTIVPSVHRAKPMPTVYSKDEIDILINTVDIATVKGIRDRAILLLGARLGMRVSDICNLQMTDIHWESNTIEFIQMKTGVLSKLELLPDIKVALSAYISNIRPATHHTKIFLQTKSPFDPIQRTAVYKIMTRYLEKTDICTAGKKTGTHALRASLATELVSEDVPYSIVRKILGHQSTLCFNNYVKLDIEKLRQCAVSVPEATGKFKEWLDNMGEIQ